MAIDYKKLAAEAEAEAKLEFSGNVVKPNYSQLAQEAELEASGQGILRPAEFNLGQQVENVTGLPVGDAYSAVKEFGEGVVDSFTGESKKVAETEALEDWQHLPEMNEFSSFLKNLSVTSATTTSSPEQIAQIFQENYPNVKMTQDAKGNYIFQSGINGKKYAIKPGMDFNDVFRGITTGLLYAPANLVKGGVQKVLGSMGTTLGLGIQKIFEGAKVEPKDLAIELASDAIPLAGMLRGKAAPVLGAADRLTSSGALKQPNIMKEAVEELPIKPTTQTPIPKVAEDIAEKIPVATQKEIGDLAVKATRSSKAKKKFAKMAMVNPKVRAMMKRLGMDFPADVASDSNKFMAAASAPRLNQASNAADEWITTIQENSARADKLLEEHGALFLSEGPTTTDVSRKVLNSMTDAREGLKSSAKKVYNEVGEVVTPGTTVSYSEAKDVAETLVAQLDKRLIKGELKNNLNIIIEGESSYLTMKTAKEQIRNSLKGKDTSFSGLSAKSLMDLDKALKADEITNVSMYMGDEVGSALKEANINYAKAADMDKTIKSMYGKTETGSIGGSILGALKTVGKDDTKLNKLLTDIPEDLHGDVLMTSIAELSRSKSSNSAVKGGFGFSEFSDLYRNMRKNGKFTKDLKDKVGEPSFNMLEDLYRVSQRVTKARSFLKGTGKDLAPMLESMKSENLVAALLKSPFGRFVASGGSSSIPFVGKAAGAVTDKAADIMSTGGDKAISAIGDLMKDESFLKLVDNATTSKNIPDSFITKLARSPKFQKFANVIDIEDKFEDRVSWIRSALLGAKQMEHNDNETNDLQTPQQ